MSKIVVNPINSAPRDGSRVLLVLLTGVVASARFIKSEKAPNLNHWIVEISGQIIFDREDHLLKYSAIRGWIPYPEIEPLRNYGSLDVIGGSEIPKTESEQEVEHHHV